MVSSARRRRNRAAHESSAPITSRWNPVRRELNATRRTAGLWETFVIYKLNAARLAAGAYETTAGEIRDGDPVIIAAFDGKFVVAEWNGAANADRATCNARETFVFRRK